MKFVLLPNMPSKQRHQLDNLFIPISLMQKPCLLQRLMMKYYPIFLPVPDPPMIDLSQSRVYNEGLIHWRLPEDSLPTDCHVLEYRKVPAKHDEESQWHLTERMHGSSTVVCDLDSDCRYAFRVRSSRNTIYSPYSPEVSFHTPPAPGNLIVNHLIHA